MNGAQAMIRTLVDAGVTTCFTNPGTSEMHFVAALDSVPEMRGVLGLFEGVATGAADGYARMTGGPAVHAAAPRAGPRQRAGQPAQRPPCHDADGQHRRRPRHVPRPVRRPAGLGHRHGGAQRVERGSVDPSAPPTCAEPRPRRCAAATAPPGSGRHADPARRRVVERRRHARRADASIGPGDGRARSDRAGRQGAALGRAGRRSCSGGSAMRRGTAARGRPHRRRHRRPAVRARRSSPAPSAVPAIPRVEKIQYFSEMAEQQLSGCATSCSSTPSRP